MAQIIPPSKDRIKNDLNFVCNQFRDSNTLETVIYNLYNSIDMFMRTLHKGIRQPGRIPLD